MPATVRIPIEESSQTASARRIASRMATDIGFNEVQAGEVAIVVTEACTNILKHAVRGEILLRVNDDTELEVLALDPGPGMRNIHECLRDGFTTSNSPGEGLGAIQRLAAESDFYSVPGEGTAILARWPATRADGAAGLRAGAVNVCKPGQEICGDSWGIEQNGDISTVMVADGLGHGYEASQASLEAVRVLRDNPELAPKPLIELCHRALRSSRGAAVAVAQIDRRRELVTFCGVGNVAAQIFSAGVQEGSRRSQHLVSVNGTSGHEASRVREFTYPWPADGTLLMHSDGLATGTGLDRRPGLAMHDPSLIAGVLYKDFGRGHDDATVVVVKAA